MTQLCAPTCTNSAFLRLERPARKPQLVVAILHRVIRLCDWRFCHCTLLSLKKSEFLASNSQSWACKLVNAKPLRPEASASL